MFTDSTAPRPSGQTGNTNKKSGSLLNTVVSTIDQYDRIFLEQASSPMGRRNPDALLEVLNRKRNQELEAENAEQAEELQQRTEELQQREEELNQLRIENGEITNELNTTANNFAKISKKHYELNQTLQDFQNGINNTVMFADKTIELSFQNHERSAIAKMKESIRDQQAMINYNNSAMTGMKEDFDSKNEEAQAKIHLLHLQLKHAAQELEESEQTITEKMNLNKTISEEKMRYLILSEEYQEKVQEYKTKIAKIEAENTLQKIHYQENMETQNTDNSKNSDKLLQMCAKWKKEADKRLEQINFLTQKLDGERSQGASSSALSEKEARKKNINMKVLTKKIQKIEAERDMFFEENVGLRRELVASRIKIQEYAERRKLSSAKKFYGKLFGKY